MLRFNRTYFLFAVILFVIEVLIALYIHDTIIRPYFGDFLVVIFLYYLVKSFIKIPVITAAAAVLMFAFLIELLQYFDIVYRLGLSGSKLAMVVIGTSFEWIDLVAYTLGVATVLLIERARTIYT